MTIGIDPGVKTGLAIYDSKAKRFIHTGTHNIIVAMELVLEHHDAFVFIEDPNLRKWYGKDAEAKQQGAGSIKRDYSVWTTFFNHYKIKFAPVAPRNVGSLPPQVIKKLTGKGRTSVHERDAICMALRKPIYDNQA